MPFAEISVEVEKGGDTKSFGACLKSHFNCGNFGVVVVRRPRFSVFLATDSLKAGHRTGIFKHAFSRRAMDTVRKLIDGQHRISRTCGNDDDEAVNKGDERITPLRDGYSRFFLKRGRILIGDHLEGRLGVKLTHLKGIWPSISKSSKQVYRLVPPGTASWGIFLFFQN